MKLQDLYESLDLEIYAKVREINSRELGVRFPKERKFINIVNGKLNVEGTVSLGSYRDAFGKKSMTEIILPFGEITRGFYCGDNPLINFKNAPYKVGGDFDAAGCPQLSSLEGLPRAVVGCIDIEDCPNLVSLENTAHIFEGIKIGKFLRITLSNIKRGGLSLVYLPSTARLVPEFGGHRPKPFQIIQKYIGTDNIIECQSELIEAGFEEYAVL